MGADNLDDFSLLDMFRQEVEQRATEMTHDLLSLEHQTPTAAVLEALMRNAHSLKGAAAIIDRQPAVQVAHALEDCFVAAQKGRLQLGPARVDILLSGVDLLARVGAVEEEEMAGWLTVHQAELDRFLQDLRRADLDTAPPIPAPAAPARDSIHGQPGLVESAAQLPPLVPPAPVTTPEPVVTTTDGKWKAATSAAGSGGRALRVTAENLNRLLGLAGEAVVASRWVHTHTGDLLRLKRLQNSAGQTFDLLRETLAKVEVNEHSQSLLADLQARLGEQRDLLGQQLEALELFDRRFDALSQRLYQEVLDCRMRPFADGVQGFPRLVRDAGRTLGKRVRLEIAGELTPVDRDILDRVEAPLGHLLRNAVDHGLESMEARILGGKPEEGRIFMEARHSAGMLVIEVSDDGAGVEPEAIRSATVRQGLTTPEVAAALTEAELLEFLFLPGFTTKEAVTQISGRGVGLDAVQAMVREVGGTVRILSQPGRGTRFLLQLPLTLSVLRTLLVEIAGEPYAFPLARIGSAVSVPRAQIETIEGRQHFTLGDQQIGLITAHQILGLEKRTGPRDEVSVIVVGEKNRRYGIVVDRLLGERELVVRPLDPRLGKIKDVAAAALMPDQSPVLIVDVEDLLRSVENLVSGDRLTPIATRATDTASLRRKRVLVVDDSLTVRELERKLIGSRGYEVEIAVDGMDGWNAVRTGRYDLVVTDIDMPRLDGIELVSLIKNDPRLQSVPVMIVSYKEREDDRRRGLEAGADYYLTKGSFHDETLLRAITDLIGDAEGP